MFQLLYFAPLLEDRLMSTTTLNGNTINVKPTQRKQLSEQLDRLDHIIDALAGGLPEAVTDAVREGARAAIKDALIEILTNPELRALLVPVPPVSPIPTPMPAASTVSPPTAPPGPTRPSLWARIKSRARAVKDAFVGAIVSAKDAVVGRCRAVRNSLVAVGVAGGEPVPVQKILVTAMAVGIVVSTACLVVPETVAAVISGVSAAATAVCVQAGGWLRRVACRVGLLA